MRNTPEENQKIVKELENFVECIVDHMKEEFFTGKDKLSDTQERTMKAFCNGWVKPFKEGKV